MSEQSMPPVIVIIGWLLRRNVSHSLTLPIRVKRKENAVGYQFAIRGQRT